MNEKGREPSEKRGFAGSTVAALDRRSPIIQSLINTIYKMPFGQRSIPRLKPFFSGATSRFVIAVIWALLFWIPSRPSHAQQIIQDPVECGTCTIDVSLSVTIGDEDGPGALPGMPMWIAADSKGRFWVTNPRYVPWVFDSEGGFISQVSRRGEGPGEFTMSYLTRVVGDSVLILDGFGRVNIIGPDLNHVRSVNMPEFYSIQDLDVLRWPAVVAASGLSLTSERAGWPLHLVDMKDRTARIIQSFGSNDGLLLPNTRRHLERRITVGDDGIIWAIDRRRYTIRKWTRHGEMTANLRRMTKWFPEPRDISEWIPGTPSRAPDPIMATVRADTAGYLWVYAHVAASDWREEWTPAMIAAATAPSVDGSRRRSVSTRMRPQDWDVYDTLVEIIDPVGKHVVARTTIDGYVCDVLDDGRVAVYRESEAGVPYIDIYAVTLHGGE